VEEISRGEGGREERVKIEWNDRARSRKERKAVNGRESGRPGQRGGKDMYIYKFIFIYIYICMCV